jgi:hypothetical protein
MEFSVNYLAIGVCAVLAMAIGAVWYGPLFGKRWMAICEVDENDLEARKKMQKEAMPLYLVQFFLVLFQVYILATILALAQGNTVVTLAATLTIWVAFIMPTIAGSSMWTNEPTKMKWARFLIQAGYQLVLFILFGLVFGLWG